MLLTTSVGKQNPYMCHGHCSASWYMTTDGYINKNTTAKQWRGVGGWGVGGGGGLANVSDLEMVMKTLEIKVLYKR